MNAYIQAVKGTKTKTFTIKAWSNLPKGKFGWKETSDYVSPEAKEIEANNTKHSNPYKPIDDMSGKELQEYIIENGLAIEGFKSMPKAKLLTAIKEYHGK